MTSPSRSLRHDLQEMLLEISKMDADPKVERIKKLAEAIMYKTLPEEEHGPFDDYESITANAAAKGRASTSLGPIQRQHKWKGGSQPRVINEHLKHKSQKGSQKGDGDAEDDQVDEATKKLFEEAKREAEEDGRLVHGNAPEGKEKPERKDSRSPSPRQ